MEFHFCLLTQMQICLDSQELTGDIRGKIDSGLLGGQYFPGENK